MESVLSLCNIQNSGVCNQTIPSVKVKEAQMSIITDARHKGIVLQQG